MAATIRYAGANLYPKQRDAIFDPARISLIEASSKSGKTVGCLAWLLEQALTGKPERNYWWCAPVFSQAEIGFRRMCAKLPKSYYKKNQSRLTIKLANGTTMWFKSAERCYDDQTEVLTDKGWRLFVDLDRTERVLTLDLDTRTAEWQYPTDYITSAYSGPMLKYKCEKVDLLVTPGHRFPTVHRNGTRSLLTLDQISSHEAIPRRTSWVGNTSDTATHDDCALVGIFLAEGSAAGCSGGTTALANGDYTVHFSQTRGIKGGDKGDVRAGIEALLTRLSYDFKETTEGVFVRNKELWSLLSPLGNRYTKRIPDRFKELPPEKLRTLLWWLVLGDGTVRKQRIETYYTVSKGLADDVQEIAVKAGLSATITVKKPGGGINLKSRRITGTVPLYQVTFLISENDYVESSTRRYVSQQDEYDGNVYCLTVPNHTMLVRRNGRVSWSGNSDDLYGEDVYAAVLDEASRMREESWHAVRSTLTATRGPVRIIGNVKGRKNWFYRLARAAETGTEDMAFHRITAWDAVEAGVLARDEIEASYRDFKRLGREGAWNQLYMAEAADDGDNPFGLAAIALCTLDGLETTREGGNSTWALPKAEWPKAAGVDLAGRGAANLNQAAADEATDRDYTAIVLLDADGTTTHLSRFRKGHTDTAAEVARVVKRVQALVDSTGTGDAVVEALQRRGDMAVEGYTFTERSRQDLLEGLSLAIGEQTVRFPDGWLRDELDSFEFRYTSRGIRFAVPDGSHDDGVMALALALKKLPWRRRYVAAPVGVAKAGGSTWTGNGSGSGAVDPLLSPPGAGAPAENAIPMPISVVGSGAGKWSGAGR